MAFIMQIVPHFPLQSFKIHYHMLISFIHRQQAEEFSSRCIVQEIIATFILLDFHFSEEIMSAAEP